MHYCFLLRITVVVEVRVFDVAPEGRGHVVFGRVHLPGHDLFRLEKLLLVRTLDSDENVCALHSQKQIIYGDKENDYIN